MDILIYEEQLISDIITSIEKHDGIKYLSSIILTGSFGRGEPTYCLDNNGLIQLKSDVEIALVFKKSGNKKVIEELIQSVSSEFKEDLNLMSINEKRVLEAYNFNFSLCIPKYKTIFTYDLFNGSKTIWGKDFIGDKSVTLAEVDTYEAKRLVANRIGELVYLQNEAKEKMDSYLQMQWKGKIMLAIVSAWLICEGQYVSSYRGQYEKIQILNNKIENLLGEEFVEDYIKVFSFLRDNGELYEISDKRLINYVRIIDDYFKNKNLNRPKVNCLSRVIKYIIKYMKTDMKYGVRKFEDNILQSLITDFANESENIIEDSNTWYRVLY